MAQFDDSLKAALYRITCPDGATLGDYHLGLLSDEAAVPVEKHLALCPRCQLEIAQLEAFLAETAVSLQPSTTERIKVWLAQRLPTGGQAQDGAHAPSFAVRGSDTGPLMFEAGDAQLSLEIQDDPERPGRKSIVGLVLGIVPAKVQAQLIQDKSIIATVPVDELGNFTLSNLHAGQYALVLTGADLEIHIPTLEI